MWVILALRAEKWGDYYPRFSALCLTSPQTIGADAVAQVRWATKLSFHEEFSMPTVTTIYRAIVMIAVAVIVVKGWQHLGPTTEQVATFGMRALDAANVAWEKLQPDSQSATLSDDPRVSVAPAAAADPTNDLSPAPLFPAAPAPTNLNAQVGEAPVNENSQSLSTAATSDGRLSSLYSRLEELGTSKPQLSSWGIDGRMYRCQCRAALADNSSAARHFEAVAVEPFAAVQQLLAKVEAWRLTQRSNSALH
jgi:hypothetical protein